MHILQSRGADPTILSENFEPYLSPGRKAPVEVAIEDEQVRSKLRALETLYRDTAKSREPHSDIGCWQALYDYGPETVKSWAKDYKHPYPGTSNLPPHVWCTDPAPNQCKVQPCISLYEVESDETGVCLFHAASTA